MFSLSKVRAAFGWGKMTACAPAAWRPSATGCFAIAITLLVLNLGLLLTVVTVPFTTSLFAEYLRDGNAAKLAAAIYSAVMLLHAILWQAFWRHAAYHGELLAAGIDPTRARASVRSFAVGTPVYALAVGLSFVSPYLVLCMHLVVAALYLRGRLNLGEMVGA